MGFGCLSYCRAEITSGFDLIADSYKLEELPENDNFDLILTGEGEINLQSSHGKAIGKIATLGKKYPIPMTALSGRIDDNIEKLYSMGISSMTSIVPGRSVLNRQSLTLKNTLKQS